MSMFAQGPIYILSFLIVISVVIVIHELGHYWAGRRFDAGVESFSIGFGRSIFERTDRNGTRWRLNWLPLGGFVKFVGENQLPGDIGKVEQGPVGKPYGALSVGQRSIVAIAGPIANFVLSSIIFAGLVLISGIPQHQISVVNVQADSPAEAAGVLPGDVLARLNGDPIENVGRFIMTIAMSANDELDLDVVRDGTPVSLQVTPERSVRENELGLTERTGRVGLELETTLTSTQRLNPVQALGSGVAETGRSIATTVTMIGRLATGREPIEQLSGPVGIANFIGTQNVQVLEIEGVGIGRKLMFLSLTLLHFIAAISVAIGFFNLLPLPVLDGGHLAFNAYEAVTGHPPSERIQGFTMSLSLVALVCMAVLVTFNDVRDTGLLKAFSSL